MKVEERLALILLQNHEINIDEFADLIGIPKLCERPADLKEVYKGMEE